ncbi:hypothetical protein DENSPDRAFT_835137 [Dentipellis sp. KUC8613]|nr:hypothetical protein DENSPDRAFT_835137 [Dentipellis sp. KUC8613]
MVDATLDDAELRLLTSAPFVTVDGVINIRDVGGYPTALDSTTIVKTGILYRSGEPTRLTAKGSEQLRALGIRKVFDLRSEAEIKKYKSPTPEIEGVEFVRIPVSQDEAYDPVSLAKRLDDFSANTAQAFAKLYDGILDHGGPAFGTIFRHIKDRPDEPCLIHCTGQFRPDF